MTSPADSTRWFRPPRPHGHVIEERSVSFLELFYDLVYVVLVAQMAHTLAAEVTWSAVRDFVVVFWLVWTAWINGTLYHDLHGGEDGRSRTYIFVQMALLALLAVFTGHAADDPGDGRGFAIVYSILLAFIAWQWFDVRRFDTPEWRGVAARYVAGLIAVVAITLVSAIVGDQDLRMALWILALAITVIGNLIVTARPQSEQMADAIRPRDSLVERFGLFTILVLGEVVVGVTDGISEVPHTFLTIATALVALSIGFGFWWTYFDFVGGRMPRAGRYGVGWIYLHLPLALSISAAGAGMVGLIEHATDARTPAPTAWLVAGSTAATVLSIAALSRMVEDHPARRTVPYTLSALAVAALVVAAARPAPWLLALILWLLLSVVWGDSFRRHTQHGVMITDRG